MNKEKPPKHHRLCFKCKAQSTGKSVKECEESFPRCGLNGGKPNDACKTTMYQDGEKIFEIIKVVDLTKLEEKNTSLQDEIKKLKSPAKKNTPPVVPKPTENTPKDADKKNSKSPKN